MWLVLRRDGRAPSQREMKSAAAGHSQSSPRFLSAGLADLTILRRDGIMKLPYVGFLCTLNTILCNNVRANFWYM